MSFVNGVYSLPLKKWRTAKSKIRKGLSLIEASMVLALSAIVVAGVIAYYQSASDNQKTEATISMLTDLLSVIHSTYASQPDYGGINTALIAGTKSLPASMVSKDGKSLSTPGGSVIEIEQGTFKDPKKQNYFRIHFGVSNNMCPIMARLDLGSSLAGFYIGTAKSEKYVKPLNVADSETVCESAPRAQSTPDQVTLYYEFH